MNISRLFSYSSRGKGLHKFCLHTYGLLLVFIFLWIELRYLSQIYSGGHPWQTGDWLINYRSGFVRRGLVGEIIRILSEFSNLQILWIAFALQGLFFAAALSFHYGIIRFLSEEKIHFNLFKISVVLLSPAGVLFNAYNPDFSLRKEIIGLALINWMYLNRLRNKGISRFYIWCSITIYAFFIFSWEAGVAFLPFVISLLLDRERIGETLRKTDLGKFYIKFLLFISALCVILSLIFHGSSVNSKVICISLQENNEIGKELCSGAIDAVSWSYSYFWSGSTIGSPLRMLGFLCIFIVACLPFFYSSTIQMHKWLAIQFGLGFLAFNVLAADTGRLIYAFACVLTNQMVFDVLNRAPGDRFSEGHLRNTKIRFTTKAVTTLTYITLWTVPASGNPWSFLRI